VNGQPRVENFRSCPDEHFAFLASFIRLVS
jgi:hypothetical protein